MHFKKMRSILFAISLCAVSFTQVHAASYTVKSGDSIFKIGVLFKNSVDTIMRDNNLSQTTIYPNQILKVNSKTYIVQATDTLYLIAKKFDISLNTLIAANSNVDKYIYPGQVLNIPSGYIFKGAAPPTIVPYSQSDLDLLARLVNAEAQSESYKAKVGVAAVVLNRVRNPKYPSTIKGVIYEKSGGYYQFTPVLNGWINKPASEESKKAAYDALHGYDPTKGALYYFDDSTTNTWLWSKPIALRDGKMVFTY
ncbi:cell wall hydrolase [Clostridium sp. HV4-5-A1G]|uniref:cell wall hydrolase n=1 Tax=Clostridium sp. HV4-5-A1G TaxID=2004595 RepID=UPI00123B4938|nr:cell wall hydrolase [Clostridium sp. HV4-5-A1G]KAA8679340.1 LysM peptidoglycan-binding domain-containing protein [Clostridium sp. HV4-5-A1G]